MDHRRQRLILRRRIRFGNQSRRRARFLADGLHVTFDVCGIHGFNFNEKSVSNSQ
jgi:hypothetical protein